MELLPPLGFTPNHPNQAPLGQQREPLGAKLPLGATDTFLQQTFPVFHLARQEEADFTSDNWSEISWESSNSDPSMQRQPTSDRLEYPGSQPESLKFENLPSATDASSEIDEQPSSDDLTTQRNQIVESSDRSPQIQADFDESVAAQSILSVTEDTQLDRSAISLSIETSLNNGATDNDSLASLDSDGLISDDALSNVQMFSQEELVSTDARNDRVESTSTTENDITDTSTIQTKTADQQLEVSSELELNDAHDTAPNHFPEELEPVQTKILQPPPANSLEPNSPSTIQRESEDTLIENGIQSESENNLTESDSLSVIPQETGVTAKPEEIPIIQPQLANPAAELEADLPSSPQADSGAELSLPETTEHIADLAASGLERPEIQNSPVEQNDAIKPTHDSVAEFATTTDLGDEISTISDPGEHINRASTSNFADVELHDRIDNSLPASDLGDVTYSQNPTSHNIQLDSLPAVDSTDELAVSESFAAKVDDEIGDQYEANLVPEINNEISNSNSDPEVSHRLNEVGESEASHLPNEDLATSEPAQSEYRENSLPSLPNHPDDLAIDRSTQYEVSISIESNEDINSTPDLIQTSPTALTPSIYSLDDPTDHFATDHVESGQFESDQFTSLNLPPLAQLQPLAAPKILTHEPLQLPSPETTISAKQEEVSTKELAAEEVAIEELIQADFVDDYTSPLEELTESVSESSLSETSLPESSFPESWSSLDELVQRSTQDQASDSWQDVVANLTAFAHDSDTTNSDESRTHKSTVSPEQENTPPPADFSTTITPQEQFTINRFSETITNNQSPATQSPNSTLSESTQTNSVASTKVEITEEDLDRMARVIYPFIQQTLLQEQERRFGGNLPLTFWSMITPPEQAKPPPDRKPQAGLILPAPIHDAKLANLSQEVYSQLRSRFVLDHERLG
jgi:hypothetical protein